MNATGRGRRYTLVGLLAFRSARALAYKIGVNPTTVARWARGEATPSGAIRKRLASELGVPADSIDFDAAA